MTFPLRGADGVFQLFLTRIQPVLDASGRVARWFGVNTEIFDLAAEEALGAERDRSRRVLDIMTEGFVLLDRVLLPPERRRPGVVHSCKRPVRLDHREEVL